MTVSRYKHEESFVAGARWGPLAVWGGQTTHSVSQVHGAIQGFAIRVPGRHQGGGFLGMHWTMMGVSPSEWPQRLALGGGREMTWDEGHMLACHEKGDKTDGSAAR